MGESPADTFRRWKAHPAQFVRELFGVTPDSWQDDVLEAFPHNQRIAMLASKGPGKELSKDLWVETPSGPIRMGQLGARLSGVCRRRHDDAGAGHIRQRP